MRPESWGGGADRLGLFLMDDSQPTTEPCFDSDALVAEGFTSEDAPPVERGAFSGRANSRLGYRFVKRTFDIVFSLCAILVGLVPIALVCLLIRLESPGSPMYLQERIGLGGKRICLCKLRSMVTDADEVSKYFTPEQLQQWKAERKVENDPRITTVGRVIRSLSIDELPNFLNVLKGDMSIVGPRPITNAELIQWFTADERERYLSVRPGVTGLWATTTRNNTTFESGERQRIELEYVDGAGIAMDLKVFFQTFKAVFKRTGR